MVSAWDGLLNNAPQWKISGVAWLHWCIEFAIQGYGDIDLFLKNRSISPYNVFKFDSTLAIYFDKKLFTEQSLYPLLSWSFC
jgi:hypothetical protein